MVTEGGLYILTLFDDFGGTYGKSGSPPIKIQSLQPIRAYKIFSTIGIVYHWNVGYYMGLRNREFLFGHSINVKTWCSYLLESLLAICLPSITFICIGSNNGIMEKIVTRWRRIPSMDKRNRFGTDFLVHFIYTWNGHSSYCQKGWNQGTFKNNLTQTPTQMIRNRFSTFSSQEIGSTWASFQMIFEALQYEIFKFSFQSLS